MSERPPPVPPVERALAMHDQTPQMRLAFLAVAEHDGPATAADIAETLDANRRGLYSRLRDLVDAGHLAAEQVARDGRGRDPRMYTVRPECPECGRRLDSGRGYMTHWGNEHKVSAVDLREMSPEDAGLEPHPPAAEEHR